MHSTKKILLTLSLIVLLPALFYSVYEISALDDTEAMIGEIYDRQLDAVLFSVNQHILDVVSGWATQTEQSLPERSFTRLLNENRSIAAVLLTDTSFHSSITYPADRRGSARALRTQMPLLERLQRFRTLSYRKLEPVIDSDSTLMLLFAPANAPEIYAALEVRSDRFIADIVSRKLTEIAGTDLILRVVRRSSGEVLTSTDPGAKGTFTHERPLWIFPDHMIQVRLNGITVEEAAQERFRRNMVLILLIDLVLIAAALFVYRTLRREMELVAMKSDFVSNVSHELRTPLALIRMFTETLEMKRVKTEKKKQEYYSIILHETERLTRLINNILNFSRMESNTRRYSFAPTDLNAVVSSVMTIYTYQFEQLRFTVEQELEKDLPLVPADGEAIAEALHNLIDNAVKYSGENKFLRVTTQRANSAVLLTVQDRGIGIAPEHHAKIFEKFYRVSRGLVHTAKGSGLGLSIVQHIIHSHGGTITIDSTQGTGSTFTISLPLSKEQ